MGRLRYCYEEVFIGGDASASYLLSQVRWKADYLYWERWKAGSLMYWVGEMELGFGRILYGAF